MKYSFVLFSKSFPVEQRVSTENQNVFGEAKVISVILSDFNTYYICFILPLWTNFKCQLSEKLTSMWFLQPIWWGLKSVPCVEYD